MPVWWPPDPRSAPPRRELLALSAQPLTAELARYGYERGLFAMGVAPGVNGWYSPDPRGVLPPTGLHVSRSLRRSLRRFTVTVDTAFAQVVTACADPGRDGAWIDDDYRTVYGQLYAAGLAHSVEVWQDGELAGGVFGVELGGLFCGESMFHRRTDASKAALVGLVERLRAAGGARVLDVQWWTPHLGSLGVVEVSRQEYLDRIAVAQSLPPAF